MTSAVDDIESPSTGEKTNPQKVGWWIVILWTVVVTLYFLWEATGYRGIFESLSEWQYARFSLALPFFTVAALVALCTVPAWLILWAMIARTRSAEEAPQTAEDRWLFSARRFQRIATMIAAGLATVAAVILLWGIFLPGQSTPVRLVAPDSSPAARAGSSADAGIVVGVVDTQLTSTMAQDLLFTRRDVRFAPIIEPDRPGTIRYFMELSTDNALEEAATGEAATDRATTMSASRVPGAILTLYRRLNYRIAEPHFLLSASPQMLRWPYLVVAGQIALIALIAFLIGLIQQRRIRRLVSAPPVPAPEQ